VMCATASEAAEEAMLIEELTDLENSNGPALVQGPYGLFCDVSIVLPRGVSGRSRVLPS
jgi:hypothetical protein